MWVKILKVIAVTPDGNYVYVANYYFYGPHYYFAEVYDSNVIRTSDNSIVKIIAVGDAPEGVAVAMAFS